MKKQWHFIQMNKASWPKVEVMLNYEHPTALSAWWVLVAFANKYGIVGISEKDIKSGMRVKSRSTVNGALKFLENKGLLIKGRRGVQNIYVLNYNLMRQTPHSQTPKKLKKDGIVFPANIVITKGNERDFYDKFKGLISGNKTGYIDLNGVKFDIDNSKGKVNRNGEKIKHRNGASKARAKAKAKRDKKRGWTTNRAEAKRLGIGYQTKIKFRQNKKPVKSDN